jgi:predicted nucleic acid-binding protein
VSGLGFGAELLDALEGVGIVYSPIESRAAVRAGEMQRRYKERRRASGEAPTGPRTVPDFLIGAHALLQCQALITRDQGFFRDYFKGLKVIVPGV